MSHRRASSAFGPEGALEPFGLHPLEKHITAARARKRESTRSVVDNPSSRLNYTHTLGMSYCFEASMNVKLCENVFDVIIHSSRADVELIGNRSGAVALCQIF